MCDATGVRFEFDQQWQANPDEVVAVYLDEEFWTGLSELSTTAPPTVLDLTRTGDRAVVRLHWVLSVELPREAARFIDPDDVAWTEVTTWELQKRSATVEFLPDQAAGLLRASASAAVEQTADGSRRAVTGDLRVRIPLLGHKVEPAIVDGVGDHLEAEAAAVAARLG